jgi:aldehyde dehydrogenase (NAD(P)+)
VVIAPGTFSEKELQFVAENVATMVVNNGSFNCNAAKMLVTSKGWAQRQDFLARVQAVIASAGTRRAYYPGARDRYEHLLEGRADVARVGSPGPDELAWAFVWGLDPATKGERLFTTEPFCAILSEVTLPETDPAAFLRAATVFCNEKLWGTLSASVIVHPHTERDPGVASALEQAITDLRYGAVAVNHWAGLVYGTVTPPWGAHPSSTLKDIQGGLGWVHNPAMLEGIEKVVLRGPLTVFPKPPWFVTHKNSLAVAQRMLAMEMAPSWFKVPGIALNAMRG